MGWRVLPQEVVEFPFAAHFAMRPAELLTTWKGVFGPSSVAARSEEMVKGEHVGHQLPQTPP
jgi:hypothetical protein